MAINVKPIQETGSSNQNVKVLPQGGTGGSTAGKSSVVEILDDKGETTPVEENGGMPEKPAAPLGLQPGPELEKESVIKKMSTQTPSIENNQVPPGPDVKSKKKKTRPRKKRPSKGTKEADLIPSNVEEGRLPIIKVNAETQTETEMSEQGADMKPGPEVEKESDIKEMSTQTPAEEYAQVPPGPDVKDKKKRMRPKKKRPSKEKKEANLIPSRDDSTQSKSVSFQLPTMSGNKMKFVCSLFLVCFVYAQVTQGLPVGIGKVYNYTFNSGIGLAGTTVTIKDGIKMLCDIQADAYREENGQCGGASVRLKNDNTLVLSSKYKSDSFLLEAGGEIYYGVESQDPMNDPAAKSIDPKEDPAPPDVPTESPHTGPTDEAMSGWKILLIAVSVVGGVGVVVGIALCKCRRRIPDLCPTSTPPPRQHELAHLNGLSDRNEPEDAATS